MKQLWPLLGIFWIFLASAKAPDPQIPGTTLNKMKDIAEAARMKYVQGKELNEGLPSTTANEKEPVSARFTISKIAKTATGTTLTIISEAGALPEVTSVGLGIVTGKNNDFVSIYYEQVSSPTDFTSAQKVTFPFDIGTLNDTDLTLFAVTGRKETDEVVAAGSVSYKATDVTPNAVNKVGVDVDGEVAIRLFYIKSPVSDNITVNGDSANLCTCTEYPCYCVGLNKADTITEVCTEVTSLEDDTIKFMLCDSTITSTDAFGSLTVNSASLTYTGDTEANLEIDGNYGGIPNSVEIVYYEATEKTAMGSVSCNPSKEVCMVAITDIKETDIDNKILVVKTDSTAVTDSSIHNFEDYKLQLSQISAQTLEARWTAAALEQFEISVDGTRTGNVVNEGNNCIAYLTSLNSANPHIISIKKTSDELGANVVGVTKQLDATTLPVLTVGKILKTGATAVQTCVTAASDVTGIANINLAFLINDVPPAIQYIYQLEYTKNIPAATETCIDFTVAAEALQGNIYTVIITAHNQANEPIAAGEVPFTRQDIALALDRVGAAAGEQTSSLRIETDKDITVNNKECKATDEICYQLASNAPANETLEVCYEATAKTRLCDGGKTADQFKEITSVDTVKLTYDVGREKILTVGATFATLSNSMEIIIHDDTKAIPKLECVITGLKASKSCITGIITEADPSNPFSILKVALDDTGDVLESHTSSFENYGTTVQQLTGDLIEVRWTASGASTYLISLDKTVEGAYDRVTVNCGGASSDKCKAYFMMLLPVQYEASVQLATGGEQNIVTGTVLMGFIVSKNLNITRMDLKDSGDTMLATVCFDHSSSSANSAELTLIDRSGNFLTSQAFSSEDFCISNLVIDTNINTSTQTRILVSVDNSTYGDADLYLLDPNTQDSPSYVFVKQVGQTTLRATWTNLNDASNYQISLNGNQVEAKVCGLRQQCERYIDFDSTATSPVTITIRENGTIEQTLSLDVNINKNIQPIAISSLEMRWDDRVQVCFTAPPEVSTYELALHVSNELLESTMSPQPVSGANGTTCLLSEKTVEVGAYVELLSLVSAFGDRGNLLASGSKVLKSIFLSASRSVYGAVMDSTFLTTWHLLDNIADINNINVKVTLLALETQGTRVVETVNVTGDVTSLDFGIQPEGKYSICVVAVVQPEGITSEEICSDIIRVHNMTVEVPHVEATPPKTTSNDAVLLTWELPLEEEVTGFCISWNKGSVSLSVPETNKDVHNPRERDGAIHPLDLVNFAKAPRKATGTEFAIVGSSKTSYEVQGLEIGQIYSTCISSIKDDVVGTRSCNEINLSQYEELEKPTNLVYDNGNLSWTGDESGMYRVEYQSRTEKKTSISLEITGTSYHLDLEPGEWDLEVRAYTNLSFSEATRITDKVEGLVLSARQSEQTSLAVSWYEEYAVGSVVPDLNEKLYEIWLQKNEDIIAGKTAVYCMGKVEDKCRYEFQNLTVLPTETVYVFVESKMTTITTKMNNEYEFTFHSISGITMLTKKVRSSDEVEVSWEEVPQAKKYLYTIYDTEVLNNTIEQGYIPETKKTLTMPNITGYWLTVQGCTDEQHCGNLAKVPLNQASGNSNDNKTTIIIAATVSSVVGIGLILFIVAVIMRKRGRRAGKRGSRKGGEEPTYDKWGARTLGQPRENRASPDELPRSPSSRQNYGIPSSFDVHS